MQEELHHLANHVRIHIYTGYKNAAHAYNNFFNKMMSILRSLCPRPLSQFWLMQCF